MSDFAQMQVSDRLVMQQEIVRRIDALGLFRSMDRAAVRDEVQVLFDRYVEALATGDASGLRLEANRLSARLAPPGAEAPDILAVLLLTRDVLARAILERYHADRALLHGALDAFEPIANGISKIAAIGFLHSREGVIAAQQASIRELSTPVLLLRDRLLILPIIGVVDPVRAHQITDQVLAAVHAHRAKVVVIDVTGMAVVDADVAGHLVRTVDAARLLGASVIVTGLSAAIAQTIVDLGVDLAKLQTVGDLQTGIEQAERILQRTPTSPPHERAAALS